MSASHVKFDRNISEAAQLQMCIVSLVFKIITLRHYNNALSKAKSFTGRPSSEVLDIKDLSVAYEEEASAEMWQFSFYSSTHQNGSDSVLDFERIQVLEYDERSQ